MKEIDPLLGKYLDGEASPEETVELLNWAGQSEDNARQYAEASILDEMARELYSEGRIPNAVGSKGKVVQWRIPLAAAALLVLSFAIPPVLWNGKAPAKETGFAVVSQSVGARWMEGKTVETGQWVGKQHIELASGLVRFDFRNGATMSVEVRPVLRSATP